MFMYNLRTGSGKKETNASDLKHSIKMFLGLFIPIFFTELLRNFERIEEIIMSYISGLGLPELLELMIIPFLVSIFVLIKQYFNDNSK